jgi:hypothetical protein
MADAEPVVRFADERAIRARVEAVVAEAGALVALVLQTVGTGKSLEKGIGRRGAREKKNCRH